MKYGRTVVFLLLVSFVVVIPATPALAQNGAAKASNTGGEATESEGGIEGSIGGQGLASALFILITGVILLTVCVEKLISYLTRAALRLEVSLFALAILFTGFEFDDTILALVLSAGDLEKAALGTALGTGLAIIGITLALTVIVREFPVDLPTDYIALFGIAPLLLIPFVLLGSLTFVHGLLLLSLFVLLFGYILVRELQRDMPVFRSSELGEAVQPDGGMALPVSVSEIPEDRYIRERSAAGWIWIFLAILALIGVIFSSILLETGSEVVIEDLGIKETVFGATILTAILTFEDIMLTIEPVRQGVPEIGVGNVIGSVLFSVTGNIGVIMLLSSLTISRSVLIFHLPALIVTTAIAAYFLHKEHLKRWHGVLLSVFYIVYWLLAIFVFGGVPIGG